MKWSTCSAGVLLKGQTSITFVCSVQAFVCPTGCERQFIEPKQHQAAEARGGVRVESFSLVRDTLKVVFKVKSALNIVEHDRMPFEPSTYLVLTRPSLVLLLMHSGFA
jgi:hypothetical protein